MKVQILGTGCKKCKQLFENTSEAISDLKIDADISKVEDLDEICAAGVMVTPALVVDGKVLLSGRLFNKNEIIEALEKLNKDR